MDAGALRLEMAPGRAVESLMEDMGSPRRSWPTPWTLEHWRDGTYPQRDARRRLAELVGLDRHLLETLDAREAVRRWLSSPNRYLGVLRPAEAVRAGRVYRVEATLEAFDTGVFV